jgi:hypothetical protein
MILTVLSPRKPEIRIEMKNMLYCFLCTLLLVALLILTSCSKEHAIERTASVSEAKTGFSLTHTLKREKPSQIDFSHKDCPSAEDKLSDRSQKDFIRWATL